MFRLFTDKDQAKLDDATTEGGEGDEGAVGYSGGGTTQADIHQEQDKDYPLDVGNEEEVDDEGNEDEAEDDGEDDDDDEDDEIDENDPEFQELVAVAKVRSSSG